MCQKGAKILHQVNMMILANTILSPKNDYHSLLNSLNYVGEKDLGNSIFIRKRLIATGKAHAFGLMSFLRNWFKKSDPAVFE